MIHSKYYQCAQTILLAMMLLLLARVAPAQPAPVSLKGTVTDSSGAVIPGAVIVLRGPGGERRTSASEVGAYSFPNLRPGNYTLRITTKGFTNFEKTGIKVDSAVTLDATMQIALEKQSVNVEDESRGTVSVDPTANAGALVLKDKDLEILSDDPDQLAQDLQALAGPSAGPNGGQIFIDGFSGGQLPPKSSIREVRLNSNPFSAEYDRMGFGRIEIFTKPGTDRFRGQAFFNFSDRVFNSRNPFALERAPYQSRLFGGSLSGPITKKSSFSFDVERREIDENALTNATILDSNLLPVQLQQVTLTPQRRISIGPRIDYQLSAKHTLVGRYHWSNVGQDNEGVGQFSLPFTSYFQGDPAHNASRAYNQGDTEQNLQLTETAIVSAKAINETRFQYRRSNVHIDGNNTIPTIQVLDSFTGGGAQVGLAGSRSNHYEISNITSYNPGAHSFKVGGRVRQSNTDDTSPQNFGGSYLFTGGVGPLLDASNNVIPGSVGAITSIERYRRTLYFQARGMSQAQIRALGGGATQFTLSAGNPLASIGQTDVGVFALDDWRIRPNITLSYGIRYETQNNIGDRADVAPRIGLAYGIKRGKGPTKTVIRAGFGVFYDRFQDSLSLQALRFNGQTQQQYIVTNPDFFPTVPTAAQLTANLSPQSIRVVDGSLHSPYIAQSAIGIDRQLPRSTSISVTYINSRGVHSLRTRNINAPLPDGNRPFGTTENMFLYESTGFLRQNQLITNVNSRFSKRFTLFGFYLLQNARGDTDGVGSLPANSYNLQGEYGRTQFDVRHRIFLGGMFTAPGKVSFSPFMVASSGMPFNITTGRDTNLDTVFTERPSFATNPNAPGVVVTKYGMFNTNPAPGETLIPRNYGTGPRQFSLNLRMSRTWGFGKRSEGPGGPDGPPPGMGGIRGGGGPGGGGRGPGGPGGGMMGGGGRGGPGGGGGGMFGGASSGKRFNLTASVSARNLFNNVNLATPVGNLSSPLFGQSTQTSGVFQGPGSSASAAGNRRIELSLRFTF